MIAERVHVSTSNVDETEKPRRDFQQKASQLGALEEIFDCDEILDSQFGRRRWLVGERSPQQ